MALAKLLRISFLGNTLMQYILFLGIVLLTFIVVKIVYFLFTKVFGVLASKTKTKLDDLLISALQKPIIFGVVIGGIYFSRNVLTLTEQARTVYLQIVNFFLIIAGTWFLIKFVDAFLSNYIHPLTQKTSSKTDDALYPLIKRFANFIIYVIAIAMVLHTLGFQITSLLAGLGIGGLAFALAAQDILSNLFGGLAILSDKPFKVGDRIKVDTYDGFVKQIGVRTTVLETFGGTNIIIPNSKIADTYMENVSREDARRVKVILGLEYSTSTKKLEQAKKILKEVIKKNKSTDNKSLVHFKSFGASSLDLQLIYWIKDLNNILGAEDEINFDIKKAFEKEKIEFAYPSQTIYIKK